jgi:polyisoprenoid-binding protein YceI
MTAVQTAPSVTGYIPGTWDIDVVHSEIGFSVRHLMVTKVKGRFGDFSGTFVTAENPLESSVEASVVLSSVDTGNADRDVHLRSVDFFDVDNHNTLEYRSTGIRRPHVARRDQARAAPARDPRFPAGHAVR